MKKLCICVMLMTLLSGCAVAETFETLGDDLLQPVMAPAGKIVLSLPEGASSQTMLGEQGDRLYFCDGYIATVQTMDRGDLERTCRSLCGFDTKSLEMVETVTDGNRRWDWIWTATGEGGDQICRAAVIDDGNYHYCVTVMADAQVVGSLEAEWSALFRSFSVG